MSIQKTLYTYCVELDANDPLSGERQKYRLPDEDIAYFAGNSVGAMPVAAEGRILHAVQEEWGNGLVGSWNQANWMTLPERLGDKVAKLLGAGPGQVVVADSTSINLYKLIVAALALRPGRTTIVSEKTSFPTDLYVMQGIAELLPDRVVLKVVDRDDIAATMNADIALLVLSHVDYRTGELVDMEKFTKIAHQNGALALWDLSHSAGVVNINLDELQVDLAVGCSYKYLNGGPGAPAYIYVASKWIAKINQPIKGWMGHAQPFSFSGQFERVDTILSMLTGTPPVLASICLEGALDTLLEADLSLIRDKSKKLGELFVDLMEDQCGQYGFTLASPHGAENRGSQISFVHEKGYHIIRALIARGVVGDYREPGLLRFGFSPVYQRYTDIWKAVSAIKDIMKAEEWAEFEGGQRLSVT